MYDNDNRLFWFVISLIIPLLLLIGNLSTENNILWTIFLFTWMGTCTSMFYLYYANES